MQLFPDASWSSFSPFTLVTQYEVSIQHYTCNEKTKSCNIHSGLGRQVPVGVP